ncbi:MAG: amino acid ABC transporter ATP-binding protein, partial [Oscillospiraceae bacterium]|nr:amino acid ABC transporter ATP-binding protein [Oscillospiraceae bacterium]
MIDVKDLRKSFGDHEVLKGINEHIYKGEKVVVIGASGSGKSTFLRCLNLLEQPTSGVITMEGQQITDPKTDINKLRQKMGMVFQHFNLFPNMTVLKNMTCAPVTLRKKSREAAEAMARQLLQRVGLADRADAYP